MLNVFKEDKKEDAQIFLMMMKARKVDLKGAECAFYKGFTNFLRSITTVSIRYMQPDVTILYSSISRKWEFGSAFSLGVALKKR